MLKRVLLLTLVSILSSAGQAQQHPTRVLERIRRIRVRHRVLALQFARQ